MVALAAVFAAGLLGAFSRPTQADVAFVANPIAFSGVCMPDYISARPAVNLRKGLARNFPRAEGMRCKVSSSQMCLPDENQNPSDLRSLNEREDDWCAQLEESDENGLESPYLHDVLLSADYRTLHRDLHSWHDIYNWFRSYHTTLRTSESALQLRRQLLEALRIGNLPEATRLRDAIIALNARDEVAHLQEKMQMAVDMEEYEQAAKLRDELFHAKLAREAANFPKHEVGLIVEHIRYHYRGVVLALDKQCMASEEWMASMQVDKLPRGRRQPFYSVLVDVNDRGPEPQITYVAQENLVPSEHGDLVDHPLVERLFEGRIEERAAPLITGSEQDSFDYRYHPGPELETMLEFMAQSQQHE